MRTFLLSLLCIFITFAAEAQELNANVTINTPKLQTTDPKVFKTLEVAMEEFLNGRQWTDDLFETNEKIDMTLTITIKEELGSDVFKADLYIQATRPIFGSGQQTALIEHADNNFNFKYTEFDPIEFTDQTYTTNIASLLAFYAYVSIGLDYDSYSPFGGSNYFQKAQDLISNVPSTLNETFQSGWRSIDRGQRNRYWIVESILSPRTQKMREGMYEYHRLGLDLMHENVDLGREATSSAIQKLKAVSKDYPNAMITQLFVNAKSDEIIQIYIKGTSEEKREVYATMVRIDPANASKYRLIRR